MRASIIRREKKDFSWLIILILIVLPLIFEFFFGQKIFNASHDSIISAQRFMYEKYGLQFYKHEDIDIGVNSGIINNTNLTSNANLFFESFLEEDNKTEIKNDFTKDLITSEIIHFMNSNFFYIIFCAILLNFINIYKIFILSMSLFASNYICSALSFIYQSPKPYMVFYKIKPAVVFNEWASPNNQLVVLISFGLCLYQALTKNKRMEKMLWAKIVIIVLLVVYGIIDIFLLFASGNCTFNHIIISSFLAVSIFLIFIYILKIDLNNPKQFYGFIKFRTLYYLVINGLLFILQFFLCLFVVDRRDTSFYENHGKEQIEKLPSYKYTFYRNHFFLDSGNLYNCFCFLMNCIAFLFLKADLYYNYHNNYNSWSEGNFEKARYELNNSLVDNPLQGEFSRVEESQWNHVGIGKGIIRLVLLILFSFGIYQLFIWLFCGFKSEVPLLIFTMIIPMSIIVSGIFYFYKVILIKLKLARPPKIKKNNTY